MNNEPPRLTDETATSNKPTLIGAAAHAFNSAFPCLTIAIFLKVLNFATGSVDQTEASVLALAAMTVGALTQIMIMPALICAALMVVVSVLRSCWQRWPIFS